MQGPTYIAIRRIQFGTGGIRALVDKNVGVTPGGPSANGKF